MSSFNKALLGILGAALVVMLFTSGALQWILLAAIVGIPAAGYLILDPSQRRRLRERGRGQIGR